MTASSKSPKPFVEAALIGLAIAAIASPTFAGNVRDHRGQPKPPQTQPHLSCAPYKYCAKQGVVVRDHRDGAPKNGK